MEVLNSELTFPIPFEKSTAEDSLSIVFRGLKIKQNKIIKSENSNLISKSLEEKSNSISSLSGLPFYSLNEVSKHQSNKSCWIVLYDRIYDVTNFLKLHPGGHDILFENAGRDATFAFHGIHSKLAVHMLKEYLIGELPEKEKLYRKKTSHSITLTDMPE